MERSQAVGGDATIAHCIASWSADFSTFVTKAAMWDAGLRVLSEADVVSMATNGEGLFGFKDKHTDAFLYVVEATEHKAALPPMARMRSVHRGRSGAATMRRAHIGQTLVAGARPQKAYASALYSGSAGDGNKILHPLVAKMEAAAQAHGKRHGLPDLLPMGVSVDAGNLHSNRFQRFHMTYPWYLCALHADGLDEKGAREILQWLVYGEGLPFQGYLLVYPPDSECAGAHISPIAVPIVDGLAVSMDAGKFAHQSVMVAEPSWWVGKALGHMCNGHLILHRNQMQRFGREQLIPAGLGIVGLCLST